MKRLVASVLILFCGALAGALAQGLDDEYVHIFSLIQEADTLSSTAPGQALAKYLDARTALDRLHKGSPDWNTKIVEYRLSYLAEKIAALSATTSPAPPPATKETKPGPQTEAGSQPTQPSGTANLQAELAGLQQRVGSLQSEKSLLEAKLKEALAMRPAAADPGELAKAEEQLRALHKENELLKLSVDKSKTAPGSTVDPKAIETLQGQLSQANRQLSDQATRLSQLTLQKEALESHLKSSTADSGALAGLRSENEQLKKQLTDLQVTRGSHNASQNPAPTPDTTGQVAQLQSEKESLRLENLALQNRVKQLTAAGAGPDVAGAVGNQTAQIKALEAERDELRKQLAASREKSGHKGKKESAAQLQDLENALAMARTRLEVFEARAVPYSPEELALLKRPEAKLTEADGKAGKKSIKELPAGAAALVKEAQRCFAAKEFDKAEAAYVQVLQQDSKNVAVLANLAAIQVEEDHFDRAEPNIKQALALDSEDAYSLYVLGILRFRQGKYDEALDALSRSAKIDPQNPEVQNYLGLALSEKGMRASAEAALRKAVQLQPGYAGAHYNLAVVYATEQPPATELAKWHYQKALAAGHPRNSELEKRFEDHP